MNWRVTALLLALLAYTVSVAAIDLENGEEINELCAGCHGEYGQGGKGGEYPRLAGQPSAFTARQLYLFRDRQRPNLAMLEYIDHRQMPDEDIEDVSAFLTTIVLPTRLPPIDENATNFDALARLQAAERVLQIPPAAGDLKLGKRSYRRECGSCHGRKGEGDQEEAVPMLVGQYTSYLWRQIEKYRSGTRIHDPEEPDEQLFQEFSDQELSNIFAHLSRLDDPF